MLHVTIADRLRPLARQLADVLRTAPADPLEPDWIATPGGGMRAWLWLELARHLGASDPDGRIVDDGIIANVTAAFPGTLRTAVLTAARDDDDDPWEVTRLVWPVLEVLRTGIDEDDPRLVERLGSGRIDYGRARRIADLFDRYHVHRPGLITRWAAGDDVDVLGDPLAPHQRWQPELWRRVRERIGEPGPPEILPDALARIRDGSLLLDLPSRLSIFGLPALPGGAGFIDLADAVAARHEVHLFLLDPSPSMAAAVRDRSLADPPRGARRRADDPGADLIPHPLLRSWARLPRETAVLLADAEARGFPAPDLVGSASADPSPSTLLHRIQADLRSGTAPDGTFRPEADDRSLEFHTAYGRTRQVEVARDAVHHALRRDPTLTEEDVLVLCPDLDAFEPLIRAGFGPSAPEGPAEAARDDEAPTLRHRIADRSLGRRNPVLAGFTAILDVAAGRIDAIALQDLLAEPAIRARFDLTDDHLARIDDWVTTANVRWGLDADHRIDFGIPETVTTNSWGDAADRLLLGAALPDDDITPTIGDLAPIGIEGDDVPLAGRLAEILDHLRHLTRALRGTRPLSDWLDLLRGTIDALLLAPDDPRDTEVVRRVLSDIGDEGAGSAGAGSIDLDHRDIRRLLGERLAALPGSPLFFRGGVTITSLDSLRGIPHRVIVLLGMDQAAFGVPAGDGDDLTAALPLLGDREARSDRRQAVLDAVLAAEDRLIVIRDGRDLRTNQDVPPAVVVSELQDLVLATLHRSDHRSDRTARSIEIDHPRQSFDERNLLPDVQVDGPWSFDPAGRRAALARRRRVDADAPFLTGLLPEPERSDEPIELAALIRAVNDPIRHLLGERLQIRLPDEDEPHDVRLPVEIDALERWKIGSRLLASARNGIDLDVLLAMEHRRGSLPLGHLGDATEEMLRDTIEVLLADAAALGVSDTPGEPLPVDVTLTDGTRIVGVVEQRFTGTRLGPAHIGVGRMKATHRLRAWLELMALIATDPSADRQAVVINRDSDAKESRAYTLCLRPAADDPPTRRDHALGVLERVVDLVRRAEREPLPIFPEVSADLQACVARGDEPSSDGWTMHLGKGDGERDTTRLVFGSASLDEILAIPSAPHDPFDDPGRAVGWARHLWNPYDDTVVDHAPELLQTGTEATP